MAFQLFTEKGEEISFDQLEDKQFWCKFGEKKEEAFVKIYAELKKLNKLNNGSFAIAIHPNKTDDPYHPDLLVNNTFIGEAKIKNSPLFMASQYNVDPQYALTMDLKDNFNYSKRLREDGLDIRLFIWVKWEAHEMRTPRSVTKVKPMGGIWTCMFSELDSLRCKTHIHWYREKFRKPPIYDINDQENKVWIEELLSFESRLLEEYKVKNIASDGYIYDQSEGRSYPSGQSSASYVFDLSKQPFESLFFKIKTN